MPKTIVITLPDEIAEEFREQLINWRDDFYSEEAEKIAVGEVSEEKKP